MEQFDTAYGYSKEDKLTGEDLLIRTVRKEAWNEAFNVFKNLTQQYPNDYELGEQVRKLVSTNYEYKKVQ